MGPLPQSIRLVSALPAPLPLSDYEPFTKLGSGAYGVVQVGDVTKTVLEDLRKACRKAFEKGATVGWSPLPRVRAVFFDMDATVIVEESLVELAAHVGKGAEVQAITERAMAGELEFGAALVERVALLRGLSAEVLAEVEERLTLCRGIQLFVAFCREIEVPTFLVSGGFTVLAASVQRKVGFAGLHANTLGIEGGMLTGRVDGPIVDAEGKKAFLLATCARLGIDPKEVAAVGDGANDLPMLRAAGVAIGFRPKAVLLDHIHAQNAEGNHAFLGPLLFGRDLSLTRGKRTLG